MTVHFYSAVAVKVATVQALASAGADPNIKDNIGDTPLHDAVILFGRPVAYINALLAAGAEPNARDSRGRTPLHVMTDSFSLGCCRRHRPGTGVGGCRPEHQEQLWRGAAS